MKTSQNRTNWRPKRKTIKQLSKNSRDSARRICVSIHVCGNQPWVSGDTWRSVDKVGTMWAIVSSRRWSQILNKLADQHSSRPRQPVYSTNIVVSVVAHKGHYTRESLWFWIQPSIYGNFPLIAIQLHFGCWSGHLLRSHRLRPQSTDTFCGLVRRIDALLLYCCVVYKISPQALRCPKRVGQLETRILKQFFFLVPPTARGKRL